MKNIREPLVAGKFYPDDKNDLSIMIENLSLQSNSNFKEPDILGIISPHAGYVFSLKTAITAYNALRNKSFRHAIIIAPSHHYNNFDFSVGDFDSYKTPFGLVKVNSELVNSLLKDQRIIFYENAHLSEHSIEVQLPILQFYFPKVDIIPIILGNQNLNNGKQLAKILAEVFHNIWDETIIIISSDLSHYYDSETAKTMDNILMNHLKNFDLEDLNSSIMNNITEACGIGGIFTIIELSKILGYNKIAHLQYSNSGEVFGDYENVVGYLSSIIYK